MMEDDFLIFKENLPEILKSYAFCSNGKIKVFCPNCFKDYTEKKIVKHFGLCTDQQKGKLFLNGGEVIMSRIRGDFLFKRFLSRFNKFLILYSSELRGIPYNQNYEYWTLEYRDPNFGVLLTGLAYVRVNWNISYYVLPAVVIFPNDKRNRGFGTKFIREIDRCYSAFGGIVIESPNNISKQIADKLGIKYYFHI